MDARLLLGVTASSSDDGQSSIVYWTCCTLGLVFDSSVTAPKISDELSPLKFVVDIPTIGCKTRCGFPRPDLKCDGPASYLDEIRYI